MTFLKVEFSCCVPRMSRPLHERQTRVDHRREHSAWKMTRSPGSSRLRQERKISPSSLALALTVVGVIA